MKFKTLALVGLLPLAVNSFASDFSYNTIEMSIQSVDPSDDKIDGATGASFTGSAELGDIFFINAGASSSRTDDVGQTGKMLGIGAHVSLGDTTDAYAQVYGVRVDLDADNDGGSIDDNGHGMILGLRHMVIDQFELTAGAEHIDIFEETDTAAFIGAYYHHTENVSIGLVVGKPDEATSYRLSLKASL